MKNWIHCFHWSYRPRYYLLRPWKWIKELFVNMRNAHMRISKGFCYPDVWNFNSWFTEIAPQMLRMLADNGYAYPGSNPFETPEKWHEWLYAMANKLERCGEDPLDVSEKENEYSQQMHEIIKSAMRRWEVSHPYEKENTTGCEFTPEEESVRERYLTREKEINDELERYIQDTFTELGKYWWCIWD